MHVIRRGNNRCAIFADDADRAIFLDRLRTAVGDHQVSVHGHVLMTTHYHLIVTPHAADALAGAMKQLGECYVSYFNRKHDRVGTPWTDRYRAIPITDERYWLTCLRYIEQNPVRAGMVSRPDAFKWSSYRVHALGEPSDWLVPHHLYLSLGATLEERLMAYRAICDVPLTDDELALQRRPAPVPRRQSGSDPAPDRGLTPV
jgi:putative transposase